MKGLNFVQDEQERIALVPPRVHKLWHTSGSIWPIRCIQVFLWSHQSSSLRHHSQTSHRKRFFYLEQTSSFLLQTKHLETKPVWTGFLKIKFLSSFLLFPSLNHIICFLVISSASWSWTAIPESLDLDSSVSNHQNTITRAQVGIHLVSCRSF